MLDLTIPARNLHAVATSSLKHTGHEDLSAALMIDFYCFLQLDHLCLEGCREESRTQSALELRRHIREYESPSEMMKGCDRFCF